MKALHPRLELSPSPPPDIPSAQVSLIPLPINDSQWSNRPKIRPSSGDAVLVAYLGNGRRPEIAQAAGYRALPGVDEEEYEGDRENNLYGDLSSRQRAGDSGVQSRSCGSPPTSSSAMVGPSLQHLAADVLQVVSPDSRHISVPRDTPDIAFSTRQLSLSDDRSVTNSYRLSMDQPENNTNSERSRKHPIAMLTPSSSGLPPLQMDSPKFESNGQILPSIRSTLGDIDHIPSEPLTLAVKDKTVLHCSGTHFTQPPPVTLRCLPPLATSQISPPRSPNETHQLSLPSPHSLPASSPYTCYTSNGLNQQPSADYGTNISSETPSTDQSASAPTPATATSVADRMSIDGITNPSVGLYVCRFKGCTAPSFQTQYLLNSHANVHSSARPHYCPVPGCPRSEGGKGFKRKNETIRHGLVHDSPGYVCPFCPGRMHKYPRPDNLQR